MYRWRRPPTAPLRQLGSEGPLPITRGQVPAESGPMEWCEHRTAFRGEASAQAETLRMVARARQALASYGTDESKRRRRYGLVAGVLFVVAALATLPAELDFDPSSRWAIYATTLVAVCTGLICLAGPGRRFRSTPRRTWWRRWPSAMSGRNTALPATWRARRPRTALRPRAVAAPAPGLVGSVGDQGLPGAPDHAQRLRLRGGLPPRGRSHAHTTPSTRISRHLTPVMR